MAAEFQKLSLVWPLVQAFVVPPPEDTPSEQVVAKDKNDTPNDDNNSWNGERIPLPVVWEWDWNRLESQEVHFEIQDKKHGGTFVQTDQPSTAKLNQLSHLAAPSAAAVRACVQEEGADILFKDTPVSIFLFHRFITKNQSNISGILCLTARLRKNKIKKKHLLPPGDG